MHIVAMAKAGRGTGIVRRCGEHVLPAPFPVGVRVLSEQRARKRSPAEVIAQVIFVQPANLLQVCQQGLLGPGREHCHLILAASSVWNRDLVTHDVNMLHAYSQSIGQPRRGPPLNPER